MKFEPGAHGAIESSPERERILQRQNPDHMNSVKISALAASVIFACLYLLLVTDFHRVEAPAGEAAPTEQQSSEYRLEPALAVVPAFDNSLPPAQVAAESSATPPARAQSIDWLNMLYPELSRIARLEDEPAVTALAELVPMLASEDPAIRLAAIESVGDMTIPAVLPVLSMALNDLDPQVRVIALESLAAQDDASVAGNIETCLYDQDPEVRMAAIDALAALEAKGSVYALASLLSDPEVSIRQHALNALGDIGGDNATRYLLQARYDPDETMRINADLILTELLVDDGRYVHHPK